MTNPRQEQHNAKKVEWMEKCFECYAENGLTGTGMKALAKACGCTPGNLYLYFDNLDDLIIQSTAYCMEKVKDEFMAKAPPTRRMWSGLWQRCRIGRRASTERSTG